MSEEVVDEIAEYCANKGLDVPELLEGFLDRYSSGGPSVLPIRQTEPLISLRRNSRLFQQNRPVADLGRKGRYVRSQSWSGPRLSGVRMSAGEVRPDRFISDRTFCAVPPSELLGDIPHGSVRRGADDASDAKLIADAADLAIGKIDLDHVLRRAD